MKTIFLTVAAFGAFALPAATLENEAIKVEVSDSGAIAEIVDKASGRVHAFAADGFSLVADGKPVVFGKATGVEELKVSLPPVTGAYSPAPIPARQLRFAFDDGTYRAILVYTLPEGKPFFEKELSVRKAKGAWTCDRLVLEDVRLARPARDIHYHDDQSLWKVPLCYYLRTDEAGGLYCGLEYPFWEHGAEGNQGVKFGFAPNYAVAKGEAFVAEKTFWGVYSNVGKTRVSWGPYPAGANRYPYDPLGYRISGLNQHYKKKILPEDAKTPVETLDYGEIWAVSDFVAYYLPKMDHKQRGVYPIGVNGWWARLWNPDTNVVTTLVKAGLQTLSVAPMYLGHDNHPNTEPRYIREMRTRPLGFPVFRKHGGRVKPTTGWFANVTRGDSRGNVIGYTDTFEPAPGFDRLVRTAAENGIGMSAFGTPLVGYLERPDWYAVTKGGGVRATHDGRGSRMSCGGCKEYMDFHFQMLDRILSRYPSMATWAFDGHSFFGYREGGGDIGLRPCYAKNHGHPAGDSKYFEWRNVQAYMAGMRALHPDVSFAIYYGLKCGGIWSLRYFNNDENYYEMGGILNNRLQCWHNENDRMRPTHKNWSTCGSDKLERLEYSLFSMYSCATRGSLAKAFRLLQQSEEAIAIFRKWLKFANDNYRFFDTRRTIFGEPGRFPADGCVRIVDGEGLVYAFTCSNAFVDARIPFDRMTCFKPGETPAYRVSVQGAATLTKEDKASCEIANPVLTYGETLRLRISPGTAVVLRVEKVAEAKREDKEVAFGKDDLIAEAFPDQSI